MSVVSHFISESKKKMAIDEYLQQRLEAAGYGGVTISKTPLGTHLVIYSMRPGFVIGRGGETIRDLARVLETNFNVTNPQISVSEIEIPELNANIVASRAAQSLKRGGHHRRAGFWALNMVMGAGALGAEIIIKGKLRTRRARYEKFKAGYLIKCGEPALKNVREAVIQVLMKTGVFGVKVRILPPDAQFPDRPNTAEDISDEQPEAPTTVTSKSDGGT